jgi:hypothetical protein
MQSTGSSPYEINLATWTIKRRAKLAHQLDPCVIEFLRPRINLKDLREMRSQRAIKLCAEWLSYCLSIGWSKDTLNDLENLWWQYHDERGNLKEFRS